MTPINFEFYNIGYRRKENAFLTKKLIFYRKYFNRLKKLVQKTKIKYGENQYLLPLIILEF